jgi:hypothetical protein
MRQAGVRTLLVWGDPRQVGELMVDPAFELVGAIPAESVTSLSREVAVFRLREGVPSAPEKDS